MTFKRGKYWWYEFVFSGARIRESTRTTDEQMAKRIERKRRVGLEESGGGIKRRKPILFQRAAAEWLKSGAHWSESTREIYQRKLNHLLPAFKNRLLVQIESSHISAFQTKRKQQGAAPAEINKECAVLRMILRKHRLWYQLAPDYRPLREPDEQGIALTNTEVRSLFAAARKSRSQSLYPALVLLVNTGLRVSELRTLRWSQVDMRDKSLIVGKSKTRGGEGRYIPLNADAFAALTEWRKNFDAPKPTHFVFPSERYGLKGHEGMKRAMVAVWDRDLDKPIGSWKTAWGACRKVAKVECRLHDLRHTFVSNLAERQNSDQTIMALAGHLSRKMMDRYSHVRNEAKRRAVEGLASSPSEVGYPQIPPQ